MNERIAYVFIISIQAKIGATIVYGNHEIGEILETGGETLGYTVEIAPMDTRIKELEFMDKETVTIAYIKPKGE